MKYIRTENGIFEIDNDKYSIVELNEHKLLHIKVNEYSLVKKVYIIKQADTIEELCDEFVGIKESKKPIVQSSYTRLKPSLYILKNDLDIKEIYGAIWTEWGLKYVAMLNEKGELELL